MQHEGCSEGERQSEEWMCAGEPEKYSLCKSIGKDMFAAGYLTHAPRFLYKDPGGILVRVGSEGQWYHERPGLFPSSLLSPPLLWAKRLCLRPPAEKIPGLGHHVLTHP